MMVSCKTSIYVVLLIIIGGTILFFFNPEESIWFPKCPFYFITGYQCPSCGIQRALYNLLHLNFVEAFYYNPFLVISIPYAILLVAVTWLEPSPKIIRLRHFCYNRKTILVYIILMVIWWVIRNVIGI